MDPHLKVSLSTDSNGRLNPRGLSVNGFRVTLAGCWDAPVIRTSGVIVNA
jgi:hypothetical protein